MPQITNTIVDASGTPVPGVKVTIALIGSWYLDGSKESISAFMWTGTTDNFGTWTVTLPPTSAYENSTYYMVREPYNVTYTFTMGDTPSVQRLRDRLTIPIPLPNTKVYKIDDLADVVSLSPTVGQFLQFNGANWVPVSVTPGGGGVGVNSVTAGNTTITVSGTVTDPVISVNAILESQVTNLVSDLANKQPIDSDLTAIAAIAPFNDDIIQRKAGAWTSRTLSQLKTDLTIDQVNNTTDVNKPVSTATQTVLNTKADLVSGVVPTAELGSGIANSTKFLRGDQSWGVPPGGGGTGTVTSVTAGNGTVSIAGTATDPTVAVNTIAESQVTNLVTDLASKAASVHTHTETNITNLTTDLASKAASVHSHAESDVTGLVSGLATKADLVANVVPTAELGTGSASSSTFLRGDQTWATPSGGTSVPTATTSQEGRSLSIIGGSYALTTDPGLTALKRFRQALATIDTLPLNWWAIGDSITEGQGANKLDNGYIYQLTRALQKRFSLNGRGGFGFLNTTSSMFSGSSGSDNYWVFSGGGSNINAGYPWGGRAYTFSAGETATLTFTGTSFVVSHRTGDSSCIPFTITIDGGAPITVTPSITGGGTVRGLYTGPVLTRGVHTAVFAPVNPANIMVIYGVTLYDGDETGGIHTYNHGLTGLTSGQWLSNFGTSFTTQQAIAPDPGLVTINLGTNDLSASTPLATFQSNLTSIITNIKAACTITPSILLVIPTERYVGTPPIPWSSYANVCRTIASGDPTVVAVVDLSEHFIDVPTAANSYSHGLINTDGVHPTNAGHIFIAQILTTRLLNNLYTLERGEASTAQLLDKANDTAVIHTTGNETVAGIKAFTSSPTVPTPTTGTQAVNKTYADGLVASGTPDATTSLKGKIQLAGDLSGTAAAPTVPSLTTKAPLLVATAIKTASYTAVSGDLVRADSSAGAFPILFPAASPPMMFAVKKTDATFNLVNLTPNGSDTIDGVTSGSLKLPNECRVFTAITGGWVVADGINPLSQLDIRYLQIAASTQSASYTLALTDAATAIECTSASAMNITVPPNSAVAFPIGSVIELLQYGAGQVTIVAGAGVTLRNPSSLTTRAQYSTISLRKRATDEWVVSGDLT